VKSINLHPTNAHDDSHLTQRDTAKQWIKAQVLDILGSKVYQSMRNYAWHFGRVYDRLAFNKHVIHRIYGGVPLSVHLDDSESASWYSRDWPEMEELNLLSSGKLKGGALVFEIGLIKGPLP